MRYPIKYVRSAFVISLLGSSFALIGRSAMGDAAGTSVVRAINNSDLSEILSGVDFVPQKGDLDIILGASAPEDLISIAENPSEDPGVRIRAYRALAHYPGVATKEALASAIREHSDGEDSDGTPVALASIGVDTILLRAAMTSLATIAGADAVDRIQEMLNHDSRDVRAAAARALAVTGSADALPYLYERRDIEQVMQVRFAIEEAIRILTEEDQGGS